MRTTVHHYFHPVGHGTFFTGEVARNGRSFKWVYDCGSRRPTTVKYCIRHLPSGLWSTEDNWIIDGKIDLLAISHFDSDHVNGLETLLSSYSVHWLALPYMTLKQRLAVATAIDQDGTTSAAVAALALDPVRYLESRNLAHKVKGIAFIQGDQDNPNIRNGSPTRSYAPLLSTEFNDLEEVRVPDGLSNDSNEDDEDFLSLRRFYKSGDEQQLTEEYNTELKSTSVDLILLKDSVPIAVPGAEFEFMFFNRDDVGLHGSISKSDLEKLRSKVSEIIVEDGVIECHKRRPSSEWVKKLRVVYKEYFGDTSPQRNNISLCMLAYPTAAGSFECRTIANLARDQPVGSLLNPLVGPITLEKNVGLLLTGDISLDSKVINKMKTHFRGRWEQIAVAQVPHHGSINSWKAGNASLFNNTSFVQCVPDDCPRGHHPHRHVRDDLNGRNVLLANYKWGVIQIYEW